MKWICFATPGDEDIYFVCIGYCKTYIGGDTVSEMHSRNGRSQDKKYKQFSFLKKKSSKSLSGTG